MAEEKEPILRPLKRIPTLKALRSIVRASDLIPPETLREMDRAERGQPSSELCDELLDDIRLDYETSGDTALAETIKSYYEE